MDPTGLLKVTIAPPFAGFLGVQGKLLHTTREKLNNGVVYAGNFEFSEFC